MVFEQIIAVMDFILSPVLFFSPHISLFLVSTLLTLIVLTVNRLTINRTFVKGIKDKIEETRENLTQAQKEGNSENVSKYLNEMMKANSEYMRHTLKATIISIIVISLFLPWVKAKFEGKVVASFPFSIEFLNSPSWNWLIWYMLVSVAIGWAIKKLLAIDYA